MPHQIERLRPDGLALEIRGAPMPLGGFVTTDTDISERKRAEIAIRDSEHLMRLVTDNIPARIAYWDMEHRLKFANKPVLERFGGHLATCVGQSDIEILGEERVAASQQLVEAARRGEAQRFEREDRSADGQVQGVVTLTMDITFVKKAEAGKMTLDPRPFELDGLLGDLAVILRANLGTKPVELRFVRDPALSPCLMGADMRLQQVLLNLAGNALKFTDSDEVVVQLRLLACKEELCRVAFTVRDTGIGIASEQQQAVFSSFSQAEASTTRRFGGTGPGLSISQRRVELMGGRIELDRELGRGSTFRFELTLPVGKAGGLSEADLAEAQAHGLEIDAALARLGGRSDICARSAQSFIKRLPALPAEIGRLLGEASRIDALRGLHTLKGEAGTLGAARLAGQAAAFEAALRKGGERDEVDAAMIAQGLATLTEQATQTVLSRLRSGWSASFVPRRSRTQRQVLTPR